MNGIDRNIATPELANILHDAAVDILVVGHTHVPFVRTVGERLVCNPGALLRDPAPGTCVATPGTFGVLDLGGPRATFEVHRAKSGEVVALAKRTRS